MPRGDGLGHTGSPVRAYNAATNTWSVTTTEHIAAFKLNGAGAIGGKLYFSGGYPDNGEPTRTSYTWEYDPATSVLTQKHDTPLHTGDGVTGVIGDKLYVVPGSCEAIGLVLAGYCNQEEGIRKLWRDPATDTWVTKAPPPHYQRNGAGAAIDTKLYLVGGTKEEFDSPTRALDVYDPATNTWKTLASLPVALIGTVGNAAAKVFRVVQGPDADGGPSTSGI